MFDGAQAPGAEVETTCFAGPCPQLAGKCRGELVEIAVGFSGVLFALSAACVSWLIVIILSPWMNSV
jgi:hypothetical protein